MATATLPNIQGVVTTGIYCRADCSASPKKSNVRPYPSTLAAQAAGFRPCLRCRPDRLAGQGADAAHPSVEQALILISDGFLDAASTDDLAARIGYSSRQLVRLFNDTIGASPDFVARSRRAHFARRLLDESDLPISQIAFAAGFRSERQMHRVVREVFDFAPTELRSKRRSGDRLEALDGGLRLRIPYLAPLPTSAMISYLSARAIPGVEEVVDGTYRRTTSTCGHPGVLEVSDAGDGRHLDVVAHVPTFTSIIDDVARIRRLFRTDENPAPARKGLRLDPVLPKDKDLAGLRLPGAWDRFETAVRIVVGQQVSVAGASTMTGRIAEAWGQPIEAVLPGGLCVLFPEPEALCDVDLTSIGLTRARAATVQGLARAVVTGNIDLAATGPIDDVVADLCALPGVGPWTAHLIAARSGGHQDAFPASDLGLRKAAAAQLGHDVTAEELEELSTQWQPHRTTAAARMWFGLSRTNPTTPDSNPKDA